jgi:hypothetical protein
MGLFDKYRDEAAKRGKISAVLQADYLGGYNDREEAKGILIFCQNLVEFKGRVSFIISAAEMADIAIEGKAEVSRRVTATRLLALGIFAFAFKKKNEEKESYITLILADGQEAIFYVKDKAPLELRGKLAGLISSLRRLNR